jgi:hypothetical protein
VATSGGYTASYDRPAADGTPCRVTVSSSASLLDLGQDLGGRWDVLVPSAATSARLGLAGLQPWDPSSDAIMLVSWDAGAVAWLEPMAANGVTGLDADLDFAALGLPMLVPEDRYALGQARLTPTPAGGGTYRQAVACGQGSGMAVTEGTLTRVSPAPLAAPTSAGALRADWRHSLFEAGLPPHDGSTPPIHSLEVLAVPVPLDVPSPFARGAPTPLLDMRVEGQGPHADVDYGTLSYGQCAPGGFQAYRFAGYLTTVSRAAPGASPAELVSSVARYDALAAAPSPIVPLVTGVRSPRLGSADALLALSGVGTSPALSWTRPAIGSPTSYRVRLYRLASLAGQTTVTLVRETVVWPTSVPTSYTFLTLVAGSTYVASVEARVSPVDGLAAGMPFREALPFGTAVVYTNVFTP